MSTPRERVLMDGVKNYLLGIQKSKQIYESLSKWEKKALKIDEKKIDKVAEKVAKNVEKYWIKQENKGKSPTTDDIKRKIREEFGKVSK